MLVPGLAAVAFDDRLHPGQGLLELDDFVEFQVGILQHLIEL